MPANATRPTRRFQDVGVIKFFVFMNENLGRPPDQGMSIRQLYLDNMRFSKYDQGIYEVVGGESGGSREPSSVACPEAI